MNIRIRQENQIDRKAVEAIIETAFKTEVYSDQTEHLLVARLRESDAFIPQLSLVAEVNGKIVGHILLTKITIKNDLNSFPSLALAPVSVLPAYQKRGIGGRLIQEAHRIATELGHSSIVLLGHADYYPRFGYELTSKYGIKLPFEAPEENCMVVELVEGSLKEVSGVVEYAKEFSNS